ncbi:glycosyltransferase family 2 protein [Gayadomonas joobiniege]|uniref:glycosyltransferase family 2 protein n=1 Tax=Gayadomonas joobiniege TaxID=1234606 RepID=UPI000371999D|nr:glycosyltransferase family A protein [Gayadomonas joobiniege]
MIKLSVIVPVYNLAEYIGPCLQSLVTQQVDFDYEIIVANDCSSDRSLEVILSYQKQYPQMIKLINNSKNLRLAKNMQLLLTHAKGQYIAYMDGDDLALPGKLQAQVDYLDEHTDTGMVYHESEIFNSETGQSSGWYCRDYYNRQYIPTQANISHLIKYGSFFQASSLMFRSHPHLNKVVDSRCQIILDQPFQILNAGFLNGSIDRLDTALGKYRLHATSFGAQTLKNVSRRERVLQDQLFAIDNGHRFDVPKQIIAEGQAHYYFATAIFFLKINQPTLFKKYIQLSDINGYRFDDRHQALIKLQDNPSEALEILS